MAQEGEDTGLQLALWPAQDAGRLDSDKRGSLSTIELELEPDLHVREADRRPIEIGHALAEVSNGIADMPNRLPPTRPALSPPVPAFAFVELDLPDRPSEQGVIGAPTQHEARPRLCHRVERIQVLAIGMIEELGLFEYVAGE